MQGSENSDSTLWLSHHHFTLGTELTDYPVTSFWLTIGGISENFVWAFGNALLTYNNQPRGVSSFTRWCSEARLGWRQPIMDNMGFEIGPTGGYITRDQSVPHSQRAYTVGAFIGLDYLFKEHFLANITLQPYAYANNGRFK